MYVANDLHGHKALVGKVVHAIESTLEVGDTLIINGDGAGARGPIMNNLVKIFYEVRRGEADFDELVKALTEIIGQKPELAKDSVFSAVHAGVFRAFMAEQYPAFKECVEQELLMVIEDTLRPISLAAKQKGVRVIYVPGNGEIVPSDFDTSDIAVERTLPPEERFYQRIAREGFFAQFGIEYVPYALRLSPKVLLLSTNLLDLPADEALSLVGESGAETADTVVVHYPPTATAGRWFHFWNPNRVDIARIDALKALLNGLSIHNAIIYFGHIHLPASDARMDQLPPAIGFGYDGDENNGLWVKPGEVIKII